MPPLSRSVVRTLVPAGAAVSLLAACQQLTNPAGSVELQQSLYDLQDQLTQLREESTMLQWQVDSLQAVVAQQDSSLRRIANLMGSPLPPR